MRPEARAAARVEVAAPECPGRPKLVSAPEHCPFMPEPGSRVLKVDVDLAVEVDANGAARAVALAGQSAGTEADQAAIACALKAKYAAGDDGNGGAVPGETCPFRLRLARYVTDVAPRNQRPCMPVETNVMPTGPYSNGTGYGNPAGCTNWPSD